MKYFEQLRFQATQTHRKNKSIVQGKQSNAVKLKVAFPVKELQGKGLHFVIKQIIAQHKGWLLLHDFVDNHRRLLGVIVGIAAQPEHDVGHHHGGEAPNHVQVGHIVQQPALAADYKVDFGFQENPKDAHHKAGRHIGYALWPELPIGYHAERQDFIV